MSDIDEWAEIENWINSLPTPSDEDIADGLLKYVKKGQRRHVRVLLLKALEMKGDILK